MRRLGCILLLALAARAGPALATGIDGLVKTHVANGLAAGTVTLVHHAGKTVYYEAAGVLKGDTPMRKDAIFRIYSMTKPITSVAALILVDEGKLDLDAPVAKYLPALADLKLADGSAPPRAPTVRDLMRHTSGFTYGLFGNTRVDQLYRRANLLGRGGTLEEMAGKLGTLPLLRPPGTKWVYSVSTDVLGRVVEVVSKQPLDVFFAERIFEPLGMKDTGFFVPDDKLDRFAANYGAGRGGLVVRDAPATSRYRRKPNFLSGGGGLVSTTDDYLRFCRMLLGGGALDRKRILKPETVAAMTRNQLPQEAPSISFGGFAVPGIGFGLGVSVATGAGESRGEYGWGGAASTTFWIHPEKKLIVISMLQLMPRASRLSNELRPLVYEAIRNE